MPIPSKFGPFQTFEFAIGPFGGYNCIGFLRTFDNPRVQIGGLSCNMNLLVDRRTISCALDRLTLLSAGSDPDIAQAVRACRTEAPFLRPARSAAPCDAETSGRRDQLGGEAAAARADRALTFARRRSSAPSLRGRLFQERIGRIPAAGAHGRRIDVPRDNPGSSLRSSPSSAFMPCLRCHPAQRIVPLRARHALLRDDLEAVAGGAGVEGLFAAVPCRQIFRRFVGRGEGARRLRERPTPPSLQTSTAPKSEPPRNSRGGSVFARSVTLPIQPTSTRTRCIGLPP